MQSIAVVGAHSITLRSGSPDGPRYGTLALRGYPFGTIVKLLILTGQRWCEIVSLCTDYIDKKEQTITLPETKNRGDLRYTAALEQHQAPVSWARSRKSLEWGREVKVLSRISSVNSTVDTS